MSNIAIDIYGLMTQWKDVIKSYINSNIVLRTIFIIFSQIYTKN